MSDCVALGASVTVVLALWLDLCRGKIPNLLIVCSLVCGLLANGLWGRGLVEALAGSAGGCAVFLVPFVLGGLGGGDVKLFAALGAWIGWPGILVAALFSAVVGGVVALAALVRNQGKWDGFRLMGTALRTRNLGWLRSSERIPYTVPTALGLAVFFVFRGSS